MISAHLQSGNQKRFWHDSRADRMALHRKLDRSRVYLYAGGPRKRGSGIACFAVQKLGLSLFPIQNSSDATANLIIAARGSFPFSRASEPNRPPQRIKRTKAIAFKAFPLIRRICFPVRVGILGSVRAGSLIGLVFKSDSSACFIAAHVESLD